MAVNIIYSVEKYIGKNLEGVKRYRLDDWYAVESRMQAQCLCVTLFRA